MYKWIDILMDTDGIEFTARFDYETEEITTLEELKKYQKLQRKLWKKHHPEETEVSAPFTVLPDDKSRVANYSPSTWTGEAWKALKETEPEPVPQPCPVCGSEAQVQNLMHQHYWVGCSSDAHICKAYGPSRPTEAEAIAAWNRLSYRKDCE
jgi:hypothetical protein